MDGATGEQAAETDTGLTYNPSSGLLSTAGITLTGALTVAGTTTLNGALVLGDAAADALTINATTTVNENMTFTDGDKAIFGTGGDLEIYHSGTHSLIQDAGTGNLYIDSQSLWLRNYSDSASMAVLTGGGAVQLFHNGSEKFTTLSTGISVTGGVVSSDNVHMRHDGVRLHFGVNDDVYIEHIHDVGLRMPDGDKLKFGDGDDLEIYHDGSNSALTHSGTGDFYVQSDQFYFRSQSTSENMITGTVNGAVAIYHDAAKKFETYANGVIVTGAIDLNGALNVSDDVALSHDGAVTTFGADGEISLTHAADVGLALNTGSTIYRTGAGQYDAAFTVREGTAGKAHFEFGHSNTSGYGSTIGAWNGGGQPFISFFSGPGTNDNTYQTHGIRGNGFHATSGSIIVYDVTTADADNQTATTRITLDTTAGNITTSGTVTATAGTTLLLKNSSGSTLKTIKGMS